MNCSFTLCKEKMFITLINIDVHYVHVESGFAYVGTKSPTRIVKPQITNIL